MRGLALALSFALAAPAFAQPAKPEPAPKKSDGSSLSLELLAKVEANYKKPRHLTATFEQTVTNVVSGKADVTSGTFRVEKPDKIRFDYLQPKRTDGKRKATYLFDGNVLWVIDHKNMQVAQKSAAGSELPSTVSFFLGAGTLARDFKVSVTADKALVPAGGTGLELTPKAPSAAYARVILVVDKAWQVTQTTIVDSSGNTQTMKLTKLELDKPAPAGTFKLDRKEIDGYKVIPLDKQP